MNAVILSFDSNEKQSVICERNSLTMKRMGAIESDSVKPPRKAQDKLHKACERASETANFCMGRNKTMHMRKHERVSDRFLVNTQVLSHALLRRGFGTSVPFICANLYHQW